MEKRGKADESRSAHRCAGLGTWTAGYPDVVLYIEFDFPFLVPICTTEKLESSIATFVGNKHE